MGRKWQIVIILRSNICWKCLNYHRLVDKYLCEKKTIEKKTATTKSFIVFNLFLFAAYMPDVCLLYIHWSTAIAFLSLLFYNVLMYIFGKTKMIYSFFFLLFCSHHLKRFGNVEVLVFAKKKKKTCTSSSQFFFFCLLWFCAFSIILLLLFWYTLLSYSIYLFLRLFCLLSNWIFSV